MTIQIALDHDEVLQAVREYLQQKGAPTDHLTLDFYEEYEGGMRVARVRAKVKVEAPEFGGPYR